MTPPSQPRSIEVMICAGLTVQLQEDANGAVCLALLGPRGGVRGVAWLNEVQQARIARFLRSRDVT